MRVISGIYKRRRFDVPHTFKARPTTDFAKENHFEDNPHFIERRVYGSVNFSFFKAMVPATGQ